MAGRRLELVGIGYRHRMHDPRRFKPWNTRPGAGIHDITFSLPSGSIVGLIGANGAGKTTLMRVICGLYQPASGEARLDDEVIAAAGLKPRGHAQVGFMPEQVSWPGPGTPRQALECLSAMRVDGNGNDIDSLFKLVGLSSRSDSPLDSLSQGMRQRLSLAAALLGNPDILVLDEPLNSLDPVAQIAFQGLIRQLAQRGHTILVSSHMLAELDRFVDRILVLHRGQVIGEGEMSEVESELGLVDSMRFCGLGQAPTEVFTAAGLAVVTSPDCIEGHWSLTVDLPSGFSQLQVTELISALAESGNSPYSATKLKHNLADILAAATGLSPAEVGLEVDEHLVIPLAKIGGEEE
jgi:ABC-type multidrug transport system ATPase subunit